jgi:hypothetical protein
MTDPEMTGRRVTEIRGTVPQETAASRTTEAVTDAITAMDVTAEATVFPAADPSATERTVDSFRKEEAAQMADLRGRMDIRGVTDLVQRALRVNDAARVVLRAAAGALTVLLAITEQMADREPDTEIKTRARALPQKLRARMQKSGARTRRDAQAAWRRISAPGKTISMRKMKH